MTLVGIHNDPYGKFSPFLERYETILDYNNIDHIRLDVNRAGFWEKVRELDLFIFRMNMMDSSQQTAKTVLPIVEGTLGIKCFPDMATWWPFDDKVKQHYLLKQNGFPVIDSWVFWDKEEALKWLETADFPLVFKLRGGASAHNVILIETKSQAGDLIRKMFGRGVSSGVIRHRGNRTIRNVSLSKRIRRLGGRMLRRLNGEDAGASWKINKNYVLFQSFLPGNAYDTRVVVIGDRAFAFRRFNRENDFRASGSGNTDLNPENIDRDFIRIAFDISRKLRFQSMAYDFIYDESGNSRVIEMSYTFPDKTIPACPGYWDPEYNWHEGYYWPQYLQLADALQNPALKQPEMLK